MLIDFNDWPADQPIEADVCIVGAGAAGLSIAREFLGQKLDVCVIESGGEVYDHATQSLYDMVNVGLPRGPEAVARVRQLGGSTNLWTGRCAPLSELDFSHREWVPHSGWPIQRADLNPYYERASEVLGLAWYDYDRSLYEQFGYDEPDALEPGKIQQQFWQFSRSYTLQGSPVRFGADYKQAFVDAENVRLFLHANLVELISDEDHTRRVKQLRLKSLQGHETTVSAKVVVLACGGIENARLLLASNGTNPEGLGNDHDQVGRYFMEHPRGTCAIATGEDLSGLQDICRLHFLDDSRGQHVYLSGLALADAMQKQAQLLNCDVSLVEYEDPESGTRALERLLKSQSADMGDDLWRVFGDLSGVAGNTYRRFIENKPAIIEPTKITFECHLEQAPNPLSRITLADETDELGVRRSQMDWRLTALEQQTIEKFTKSLAAELSRHKLARIRIEDWVLDRDPTWTRGVQDVAHHMGSTRMSASETEGVVNRDSRLHATDNLFIAGSSVFATAGCVNPTFTIVAQSIRLADHIKTIMSA